MSSPMENGGSPEYGAPGYGAPEGGAPEYGGGSPEYGAPAAPAGESAGNSTVNSIGDVVGGLGQDVGDLLDL